MLTPLSEGEGDQLTMAEDPRNVAFGANKKRMLWKQLSMRETRREAKWERRRRQVLLQRKRMMEGVPEEGEEEEERREGNGSARAMSLTDEDLDELRGSIDLGFGFSEEGGGQTLCDTLPALDLYFAVNRHISDPKFRASQSPVSSPNTATTPSSPAGSAESPTSQHSAGSSDSWKILSPGDNPEAVKTRLRHWAQVVACSVRHCC